MAPSDTPPEDRGARRLRSFLGAKIVLRDGSASIACTIRNRSDGGAKIEVAAMQLVPKRFYLVVPKDRLVYDAELVWREGSEAGLKLLGIIEEYPPNDSHLQRVRAILNDS